MSVEAQGPEETWWPPRAKGESVPGAGVLGMWLFLASLAMPFFTAVVAYFVIRAQTEVWLPHPDQGLPGALWVSTITLLIASLFAHVAYRAVLRDDQKKLRWTSIVTLVLAVAFSVSQCFAWGAVQPLHDTPDRGGMFLATFYLLTVLHAAHVVGGVGLQGWVTYRACQGSYWSYFHPGVRYSMMYWHFVDVMWLMMFGTLLYGT